MVQVREGAAVVLKLWKQSLTCSDGRKSPRQVLSFADWPSVNTDDSREKSEYHENGLTVSCAVIDRNESGSKTCWVSFVDWSPVNTYDSQEKSETMKMGWQYPVQWLTETSLSLKLVKCLLWTGPPWKHATSWRQSFRFFWEFFFILKIEQMTMTHM